MQKQCIIHRIQERMGAIDRLTSYCGYPVPKWLEVMMVKVHTQLTEIRQHAESNCRKILTPACKFSPPVKLWYDRIHAYRQLIRLQEGETNNGRNIYRFASQNNIEKSEQLSREELEDGLQLARIQKADLRKQARGLWQTHLQDCLIEAQNKNQKEQVQAIKQRLQREGNKQMWHRIKQTVKDP